MPPEEHVLEPIPPKPRLVHPSPQPIHPAIKKVWQFSAVLSWGIAAIIFGGIEFAIVHFALEQPIWLPLSPFVCIAFGVASWIIADRQYRFWTYQLTDDALVITQGYWWRTVRTVARGRVQHLDINSGPLDRRWGLVQVSVYVAGAMGSVGSIAGLTPEEAEDLRGAILESQSADV